MHFLSCQLQNQIAKISKTHYKNNMSSHPISAACLIEFNEKLLLLQTRAKTDMTWDIPHGSVYGKETIEQAIITEVEESTGLNIENPELIRLYNLINGNQIDNHFLFFKRLNDWEAMKLKMVASEKVVARFFSSREIELILEQGLVKDALSISRLREYLQKPKKPFSLELINNRA
jgi:ADP-ribose pyrophosphatase YjhB (NUDIX family)